VFMRCPIMSTIGPAGLRNPRGHGPQKLFDRVRRAHDPVVDLVTGHFELLSQESNAEVRGCRRSSTRAQPLAVVQIAPLVQYIYRLR
jgi:hypothetical protein